MRPNPQARQDINGRFRIEPNWPQGGMVSRPLDDRRWDVQAYTGYASSKVKAGQWDRGVLMRATTPVFAANGRALFMYDPTNPQTWNNVH